MSGVDGVSVKTASGLTTALISAAWLGNGKSSTASASIISENVRAASATWAETKLPCPDHCAKSSQNRLDMTSDASCWAIKSFQ